MGNDGPEMTNGSDAPRAAYVPPHMRNGGNKEGMEDRGQAQKENGFSNSGGNFGGFRGGSNGGGGGYGGDSGYGGANAGGQGGGYARGGGGGGYGGGKGGDRGGDSGWNSNTNGYSGGGGNSYGGGGKGGGGKGGGGAAYTPERDSDGGPMGTNYIHEIMKEYESKAASWGNDGPQLTGKEIGADETDLTEAKVWGGGEIPPPYTSFNSCQFSKQIMAMIFNMGFAAPTPIQAYCWPVAQHSRD